MAEAKPTDSVAHTHSEDVANDHFDLEHQKNLERSNENGVHGFTADESTLPKGYFYSPYFLGSLFAIGMGLWAGVAGFAYAAPILGVINADIGPSPYLSWVAIVYTLCVAVGLTLVGRLTDLFGRRYFFIGGGALGTLGSIVCATAQSVNTLIGGMTLIGCGAATQLSFHFVTAELVPMRARFWSVAVIYLFSIPGSGFGPAISEAFINRYPGVGWRGTFYFLIAINVAALASWVCFYWPPNFETKHQNARKMDWIKNFDYVGTILYTAGLTLFLMGLSLGGGVYPWASAQTLTPLLIGVACLIGLGFWIWFATPKEPLIPKHILQNGPFVASAVVLGLGASCYYAFAIIWPQMVAVLYAQGDPIYGGYLSSVVGACFILGQILGGVFAKPIGKVKWQVVVTLSVGGALLGAMASCNADTKDRAIGFLIVSCVLIGWTESVCLTLLTISIKDQQEIGTAGGIGASIRSGTATVCQTIYVVVLTNRLATTIPAQVPPAAIEAGLPSSSVVDLLTAFTIGTPEAFAAVPGITDSIIAAASSAYQAASSDAYHTIFYTSIAFTGIGVILSFFVPNVDNLMTKDVATRLQHDKGAARDVPISEKVVEDSQRA